jgi:hypothetical protein
MKNIISSFRYKLALLPFTIMAAFCALAQEGTSSESHSVESHSTSAPADTVTIWYMSPWVWVAAGVALLLILLLIFRGGGSNRTSVTRVTEVRREM